MKDLIFLDYVDFLKKIIDWVIYIPILTILVLLYLFMECGFVSYPSLKYFLSIAFFVAPFISRKLFWGLFYLPNLVAFTKTLNCSIDTDDSFKKAWSQYTKICYIINHKRISSGGVFVAYYLLMIKFNHLLASLQINAGTGGLKIDTKYQEDLLFYTYTCIVCDFASSYDVKQHGIIASKFIEEPLNQISFEKVLIQIIKDCHNDGNGFLSTLALQHSIMIYLRLPEEKRKIIIHFFTHISDLNIGWLNRRVFEVVISTLMIDSSPEEELKKLEMELRKKKIEKFNHKYDFTELVLTPIISNMGLENAE